MNCAEKLLEPTIFLQFIHQVTIEIRFRKSLAQEIFRSNLEFRNQIIVSSHVFWCSKELSYRVLAER